MNETGRVEAFSDGVMAIAITLLVLDLGVPARRQGQSLFAALGNEWPSFLAYVVSFLVIGIIWVNHHAMFSMVARVDRWVLFANLLLLLVVSAIPFPTRLLADYLRAGGSAAHEAAAVYSATMVLMSIAYSLLWYSIAQRPGMLEHELSPDEARAAGLRFGAGTVVYVATIGLAFVSAVATLVVHGVIAVYYCFDQLSRPAATEAAPAD